VTAVTTRLRWAGRAARLAWRDPAEGLDRALIRARRIAGVAERVGSPDAPDADWERHLHEQLRVDWPCEAAADLAAVLDTARDQLRSRGLVVGRGAYGGWDDADPALARAVFCLTAHLPARRVVETGVARGVTSRVILEGLERNGSGHLWSIDLPSLDPDLHSQIGAAVAEGPTERWSYLAGTSRRELPRLLERLGAIDLFVHDSLHSERNLRFELERAWPALRAGGAIVADDVERNAAFCDFSRSLPGAVSLVARADDGRAQLGILLKPPAD
jgi:predicted O-methyltransferase YrrM